MCFLLSLSGGRGGGVALFAVIVRGTGVLYFLLSLSRGRGFVLSTVIVRGRGGCTFCCHCQVNGGGGGVYFLLSL